MPLYEFRYFIPASEAPACERADLASDEAARARAASELLRMPARLAVEVWSDDRLIWRRLRGPPPGGFSSPPQIAS